MHNSYYLIQQISSKLKVFLPGWKLAGCFSQNKDELILGFYLNQEEFFIRADLRSKFSCLSFPQSWHRARRNSVDLFKPLEELTVTEVFQYSNERAFHISFPNNYLLLFKLFGNQSNIILLRNESIIEVFKKNISRDHSIIIDQLNREFRQDYQGFLSVKGEVKRIHPTFDNTLLRVLSDRGFESANIKEKWALLQELINELHAGLYYIFEKDQTIKLSLIKPKEYLESLGDPLIVISRFYDAYIRKESLNREKSIFIQQLLKFIRYTENYLKKTQQKLEIIRTETRYDQIADILMANLHNIKPGIERTTLFNFYTNQEIIIRLKKNLSPQKNAENYYRKSKNQGKEINSLSKNISDKKRTLEIKKKLLVHIGETTNLKELRSIIKEEKTNESQKKLSPFKEYSSMNYRILVGRNAKNNDELTFKTASKEDLWLHARSVKGSHVIIRNIPGQRFPRPVIEKAAQLAAFYSKSRNETTCSVIFTPQKYVRKGKGMVSGEVKIEKENVVYVQPMDFRD